MNTLEEKKDIFYEHFNLFMNSGVSTNVTTLGNDTMSIILRKKDCIKTYEAFLLSIHCTGMRWRERL